MFYPQEPEPDRQRISRGDEKIPQDLRRLGTSHFCKGIDRAHGKSDVKPRVKNPLTVDVLFSARQTEPGETRESRVVWIGLARSYLLLCRVSDLGLIWAYNDGLKHPDFCLRRENLSFFAGLRKLAWDDKHRADRVEVRFRASKADNKRLGAIITRTRVENLSCLSGGGEVLSFRCWYIQR